MQLRKSPSEAREACEAYEATVCEGIDTVSPMNVLFSRFPGAGDTQTGPSAPVASAKRDVGRFCADSHKPEKRLHNYGVCAGRAQQFRLLPG
ncbi:unnamed protein product [Protopolystoma xenopodis]|uniref:Uncharacterized protein n=1 Tax=Protopolystoma xenopodis TaxID=117903 RepID=A0A3S5B3B6_9PLAT|nr:unnamed protein product [Protopolystoma xenopodis]